MGKWLVVAGVLIAAALACPAEEPRSLLSAAFDTDPRKAGWTLEPAAGDGLQGTWAAGEIRTSGQQWKSPRLAVEPLQYYRLTLRFRGTTRGFWAAVFFDANGHVLSSDHYSGLPISAVWRSEEFCFRARHDARTCQLWFHPLDAGTGETCVAAVNVVPITRREVAGWADRVFREIPPLCFNPTAELSRQLPRTLQTLKAGRKLRVVLLGDSIINDTSNSALDALLERAFPGAQVEFVVSVRGGTGCQFYCQENRVEQYVLAHKPDLLVIGGISNGFDLQAIRSVIRQVREHASPEILLLSDPVGIYGDPRAWPNMMIEPGKKGDEWRRCLAALGPYRMGLRQLANEEQAAFFDIGTAWANYIAQAGKPYEFFLRDPVHCNERGRQVLARMVLAAFISPTLTTPDDHTRSP